MYRDPPISQRTATSFPTTTLCRSQGGSSWRRYRRGVVIGIGPRGLNFRYVLQKILPVAKPWGGGPSAGWWRGSDGCAIAPPSALRAATSPCLRHRAEHILTPDRSRSSRTRHTPRPNPSLAASRTPRSPRRVGHSLVRCRDRQHTLTHSIH